MELLREVNALHYSDELDFSKFIDHELHFFRRTNACPCTYFLLSIVGLLSCCIAIGPICFDKS